MVPSWEKWFQLDVVLVGKVRAWVWGMAYKVGALNGSIAVNSQ
jgi:hypothetical protein